MDDDDDEMMMWSIFVLFCTLLLTTMSAAVVIQGTCGWSDQTLLDCKRFYPFNIKSSVEKLRYYSRCGNFGCVEVDSSTYNIPTSGTVSKWVDSTPNGFKFHFKAFGFLVNGGGKASTLPNEIRSKYLSNYHCNKDKYLSIDSIGDAAASAIWKCFHDALRPLHAHSGHVRLRGAIPLQHGGRCRGGHQAGDLCCHPGHVDQAAAARERPVARGGGALEARA
jgi:hypothetical protein